MSNIVIQEYDYTTAGNLQYSNFGVAVPGFVQPGRTYAEVIAALDNLGLTLDENGVIEFTYASEFKQAIGLGNRVVQGAVTAPVAPITQNLADLPAERYSIKNYAEYRTIYDAHVNVDGNVYGFSLSDKGKTGKLQLKGIVKYHEISNAVGYFEYLGEANADAKITFVVGGEYENDAQYIAYITFTALTSNPENEDAYIALINYKNAEVQGCNMPVLILTGNEGANSVQIENQTYFGNQFAYELLGLGYPVSYKLLDKIEYDATTQEYKFSTDEIEDITSDAFWQPLADRSVYEFRYVITGLLTNNEGANNAICKLASFANQNATGRGDIIALCDVDKNDYLTNSNTTQLQAAKKIAKAAASISNADKFSAIFAPTVEYAYTNTNYNNQEFSGSFHYLMCAANSINNNFKEWFANTGYQRGVGRFTVVGTPGVKLGDQAVKYLQPRVITNGVTKAVNLIIKLKDAYYLWGNRTAHPLDNVGLKASHFLNIRQLCATLNKVIYNTCKKLTFDPNSTVLWINFKNAIRPTLEAMKADQGIEEYRFLLLPSQRKAELRAQVKIVPIEAVEDFYIGIALVDSIEDVTVTVTEN